MKNMITGLLGIAILAGCGNNSQTRVTGDDSDTNAGQESLVQEEQTDKQGIGGVDNCYRFIAQKDTYDIRITRHADMVSGQMHFNNYQKDDSRGSFTGVVLENNIIKTVYRFESEGMQSIREIYFKDEGDKLITGIGEEMVEGDSAYVKDAKNLSFTGNSFQKIDCEN